MKEKYDNAFKSAIELTEVKDDLKYGDEKWDSIAHMQLVSELEKEFNIELAVDDIMAIDSYKKGAEVLRKYGVEW